MEHPLEESLSDPRDQYTFWAGETASRIDRCYVPTAWSDQVQWVWPSLPPVESDHQQVTVHFRFRDRSMQPRRAPTVAYPIRSESQDRMVSELLTALHSAQVGREAAAHSWDDHVKRSVSVISHVARRSKQQVRRYARKLKARERCDLVFRRQWVENAREDHRIHHLMRLGSKMERTA